MGGWIGVDLDGTLAQYDGWKDGAVGEPIPMMLARVKQWLEQGIEVRIVTARVSLLRGLSEQVAYERMKDIKRQRELIDAWCEKHVGQRLKVTNEKDFAMVMLWDDRCVQIECNTGRAVGTHERALADALEQVLSYWHLDAIDAECQAIWRSCHQTLQAAREAGV